MSLDFATFSQKPQYQHMGLAREILVDLATMQDRVQQAKANNSLYNRIAVFAWIGLFASLVGGLFLPLLFGLVAIAIGVLLVLWTLKSTERPWLIPEERYCLARGLINKVIRDMALEPSLYLVLDCFPPKVEHKRIDTIPDPNRARWKIDRYADPWLLLEGQFLDQTEFTLILTELYIEKYGWKRSRSGKMKHKRKGKFKGLSLTLTLRFQRKKYGAVTLFQDSLTEALNLPETVQVKQLKVSDRTLSLTLKMPASVSTDLLGYASNIEVKQVEDLITRMFLSLYHVLHLAQKLSKVTL